MNGELKNYLLEKYPGTSLELLDDIAYSLRYVFIFLIATLALAVISQAIILYLLPYSATLQYLFLDTVAKHQAAFKASKDPELVKAQKLKILEGKGLGLFPCLSYNHVIHQNDNKTTKN